MMHPESYNSGSLLRPPYLIIQSQPILFVAPEGQCLSFNPSTSIAKCNIASHQIYPLIDNRLGRSMKPLLVKMHKRVHRFKHPQNLTNFYILNLELPLDLISFNGLKSADLVRFLVFR